MWRAERWENLAGRAWKLRYTPTSCAPAAGIKNAAGIPAWILVFRFVMCSWISRGEQTAPECFLTSISSSAWAAVGKATTSDTANAQNEQRNTAHRKPITDETPTIERSTVNRCFRVDRNRVRYHFSARAPRRRSEKMETQVKKGFLFVMRTGKKRWPIV